MAYEYRFFKGGKILSTTEIELSQVLEDCVEISRTTFLEYVPYALFRSVKHTLDPMTFLLCTEDWEMKFYGIEYADGTVIVFFTYLNLVRMINLEA
jgi:hypothetical protein